FIDYTKFVNTENPNPEDFIIKSGKKRIALLDEVRGFLLLTMLLYHSYYLLSTYFGISFGETLLRLSAPAVPLVAATFILISGICVRLSRDVPKRGLLLLAFALLFSVVTIGVLPRFRIVGMGTWFGILHLIACSKLLFAAGGGLFDKIPPFLGALASLFLFIFTSGVQGGSFGFFDALQLSLPEWLYRNNWLFFLGFHNGDFYSWDYFPLLPYFFLFLFGAFLGIYAQKKQFPAWVEKPHMLFFGWLGRHALTLYVLHLPVLYGLFFLVTEIFKKT
ncbi:MAG: DUF1624 domain-containing protein, partial [Oscillospiraceae bacterium]|nr:DUF1624 domain-containing protein [Oscillospiraceae bacterium]